jgi:hypothetical protein
VVLPLEGGGAFEVENVGSVFNDAKQGGVAVFVSADFAKPVFGKKAAFGARLNLVSCLLECVREVFSRAGWCGENMKSETFGGAGTDAGKFTKGGDEPKGGGRVVGH